MDEAKIYNELGVVLTLIAVGLFASFGLTLPAREVSLYSLSFTLSGRMLLGLVLLGLACTGTDAIVRGHPKIQPQQLRLSFLSWILPSALTFVAWALLARLAGIANRLMGVMVTSGLLAVLIRAEYYTVDPTARWRIVVRFFLQLMAYPLATLLYLAISLNFSAGATAALAAALASALLNLRLLCDDDCSLERLWPYALGLAALLGFTFWLSGFWATTPLLRSLVLVMLLYVLTGIAREWLLGRLIGRVVVEHLLVGLAALVLLFSYAR